MLWCTGKEHGEIYDHHFVEFTYADGSKMYSQCRHQRNCWNSVNEFAYGSKGSCHIGRSEIKVAPERQVRVGELLRNLEHAGGHCGGALGLPGLLSEYRQAGDGPAQSKVIPKGFADHARPLERRFDFGVRVAPSRGERSSERELERHFARVAFPTRGFCRNLGFSRKPGFCREQRDGMAQVADRLFVGRARHRALAGSLVTRDCRETPTCSNAIMRRAEPLPRREQ